MNLKQGVEVCQETDTIYTCEFKTMHAPCHGEEWLAARVHLRSKNHPGLELEK